ncbi:MAG: helix-turn-helix domain-containing protein [Pseudomonadota bacterium]
MSSVQNPTKAKILTATVAMLEDRAARPVRVADIAKRAGISRQALYLHYPTRAELFIAAARHVDTLADVDRHFAQSRAATGGREKLSAIIEAWASYLPNVVAVAAALRDLQDTDEGAAAAYADRMGAVRDGCAATVAALAADGDLTPALSEMEATDALWTLVSVESFERLTNACGWTPDAVARVWHHMATRALIGGVC